jgi:hypothetical protein
MANGTEAEKMAVRWQYMKGDGFYDELLRAAAHADLRNLIKIEAEWPAVGEAVRRWKNEPGWAQHIEGDRAPPAQIPKPEAAP